MGDEREFERGRRCHSFASTVLFNFEPIKNQLKRRREERGGGERRGKERERRERERDRGGKRAG